MALEDIWQACRSLRIKEERELSEEYAELVFFAEELSSWHALLESYLGKAVKPAGAVPTPEQLAATKEFGFIYKDQTLFQKELDGKSAIAMLWPWADGMHITLKMAYVGCCAAQ